MNFGCGKDLELLKATLQTELRHAVVPSRCRAELASASS